MRMNSDDRLDDRLAANQPCDRLFSSRSAFMPPPQVARIVIATASVLRNRLLSLGAPGRVFSRADARANLLLGRQLPN